MKGGFCSIMKSIISKFLLIIFIIIIISINGCNDLINSTQYGTATIKGKVINAVDSTGIGGATIRCNTTYTTNTDSLCNYIVNNVYLDNT